MPRCEQNTAVRVHNADTSPYCEQRSEELGASLHRLQSDLFPLGAKIVLGTVLDKLSQGVPCQQTATSYKHTLSGSALPWDTRVRHTLSGSACQQTPESNPRTQSGRALAADTRVTPTHCQGVPWPQTPKTYQHILSGSTLPPDTKATPTPSQRTPYEDGDWLTNGHVTQSDHHSCTFTECTKWRPWHVYVCTIPQAD